MVRKMIALLGLASILPAAGAAQAQDIIANQYYGSGVHRYYSGNLLAAHSDFSSAIQSGSQDPRPYYYRALANMRLGRQAEAQADMMRGADLESADINGSYEVSKALERIQGQTRMQLERYRVQARAIARQRQDQQRRERYAASRRAEAERVQRAGALQEDVGARRVARPQAADPFDDAAATGRLPPGSADPFADAPPANERPAVRRPAADAVAQPPAPAAATADPFGDAPPAAERAVEDAASPFGATETQPPKPADAGASPFGGAEAERAAPAEVPAPTNSDPFGDGQNPPTARTAPAATPADASDPFGASSTPPATGADAASDPFGGATNRAAPANPAAPNEPAPTTSNPSAGENPFGSPPPANNAAAGSGGASTPASGGVTGGLFRALGRAVGVDAARGTAESVMRAVPIGRPGPNNGMSPPNGGAFRAPPAAGAIQPGAVAPSAADPFGNPGPAATPSAASEDPFGPPDAAPPPSTDPFGAPPAAAPQPAAAGDNPFQDDAVQPAAPPAADPFGGAR